MLSSVQPHPATRPYKVVRPRPGVDVIFVSLSRKIFGISTHYGNHGTYRCVGAKHCTACKGGDPPRWQGYLIGEGEESGTVALIHLTYNAARDLQNTERLTRGLLGARIRLHRKGPQSNGEVAATCHGWKDDASEVGWNFLRQMVHALYRIFCDDNEPNKAA